MNNFFGDPLVVDYSVTSLYNYLKVIFPGTTQLS